MIFIKKEGTNLVNRRHEAGEGLLYEGLIGSTEHQKMCSVGVNKYLLPFKCLSTSIQHQLVKGRNEPGVIGWLN